MRVPTSPDRRFASPPTAFEEIDVHGLEHDLARAVEGEVRFKPGDRALYTTGGSNYRQVPIGAVIPRTTDDVVETVRLCREYRAPVLAHGGGTSLAGQCCNVAVVIDFSKYLNRIVEIDSAQQLARVQPGLILDHLRKPAEQQYELTFGPDPSTHDHCTLGGMIGNNSCGVRSIMAQFYGPGPRMSDNVAELDVLLYDGRRLRVRHGTSGDPEIGGETKDEADGKAHDLMAQLKKAAEPPTDMKLYDDKEQEAHVWEVREAGLGATAFIPGKPDTYEGWEDSAVPPERLGEYLRSLRRLASKYGYESALYGHYGQGCIHARWNWDLVTRDGIRTFRRFLDEASDLVLHLGGSLSGEHGDGQSRAELLPKMFGDDLVRAFEEFKSIWDPDWKMNPGKVVDAYGITENLRIGTGFNPPHAETHFKWPEDEGNFNRVVLRCVGVGECRRHEKGTMCPSYRVTREERHSTRGRARLLW